MCLKLATEVYFHAFILKLEGFLIIKCSLSALFLQYVLDRLEERWRDEEGTFAGHLAETDAPLADSCSALWKECYALVTKMEEEALEMPPEMRAVHSHLSDLHRQLQELAEREHTNTEVEQVVSKLHLIDLSRCERGGVFCGDIEAPLPGQSVCSELLAANFELARQVASSAHDEPKELRDVADTLRGIYNDLRKLSGQRHHSDADVAHYRFLLMAIASAEAEYAGEWKDSKAEKLLEKCMNMVQELEISAEPMGPAMAAVHQRLQSLKRELSAAVSKNGRLAQGDMSRWVEEAHALDNERATGSGVFGGGDGGVAAPAGQAVCKHLLDDCFK